MAADRDTAVVWNVEPLVRVGRPRVGQFETRQPRRPCRCRPQPDRAIDMQPGAVCMGDLGELAGRVERAGVDVAGLAAHDGRAVGTAGEDSLEVGRDHRPVGVDRDLRHRSCSDPEESGAPWHRHVHLVADDQANRRRTGQAVELDVPTDRCQDVMTRRGERGGVGHLATGDEGERRVLGQAEHVDQPPAGDLLDHRCRRAAARTGRCSGPMR